MVDSVAFNDQNYTYVNAHELAHQWFGNLVTASGSKHHWLHEGFATYYQWLSEQNLYGKDFYDWELKKAADLVFMASLADSLPLAHPKAGSSRFYQKGGWVLHMLNQKMGREAFRAGIKNYLEKYQYGIVQTDSFRLVMEEACGCELAPFFNTWVHSAGEPWLTVTERQDKKSLRVKLQKDMPLSLPLQFVVVYEKIKPDTITFNFKADTSKAEVLLSRKPAKVAYWLLANGDEILAHIKVRKRFNYWEQQYLNAPDLLDRYRTVYAMREISGKKQKKFLQQVLQNDDEWFALRAEALEQLIALEDEKEAREKWLLYALQSPDVQLQKKAVKLVEKPGESLRAILSYLRSKGRSYQLRDAALQRTIDFENPQQNRWLYDPVWEKEPGIPGHKVHITSLVYQLLLFKDRAAFQQLSDYASNAYDFMTRQNAIEVITALGIADEKTVASLFDALFDPNWKLRSSAKKALQKLNEGPNAELIANYRSTHEKQWSDFQMRLVQRTFEPQ